MGNSSNKNTNLPTVSNEASLQFRSILKNEKTDSYVRLLVDAGGCSGFSYKFSVDSNKINDEDIAILKDNDRNIFVIDKISLNFLKNSKIGWQNDLTGSQFLIENPLAKSKCGCGSSFSL